jgi:uncharacterized membrane protein
VIEHEMLFAAFDGESQAHAVLDTLKGLKSRHIVDLRGAAVVAQPSENKVRIK